MYSYTWYNYSEIKFNGISVHLNAFFVAECPQVTRPHRQRYYRLGAALMDLKNPVIIHARTNEAILEPGKTYEKEGQVPNVVFPCGHVLRGDTVYHYYGGADSVVAVATTKLSDLLAMLA